MFVLPGIIGLIVFIYVRPQEILTSLASVPFLYIWLGIACFGFVIDTKLGYIKLQKTPQLAYATLFVGWCTATLILKGEPSGFVKALIPLYVSFVAYLLMAHGVQTFRGLQVLAVTVLCASLFVTSVGIHQGFAPFGCAKMAGGDDRDKVVPDGRPCEEIEDCSGPDAEPGAYYVCERVGLFGTTSVARGRVRYRGVLQDPNEVALTISAALPFAFALRERKRTTFNSVFLVVVLVLIALCAVLTKSRGGQLVFTAALGAYFIKKYGIKGIVAGGVLALPLILLGGRSDSRAEGSSEERTEILGVGRDMIIDSPVLGVGYDQFLEYHILTAHNSYLLAIAELGPIGLFLFTVILYVSVKTLYQALQTYADVPGAGSARTWSMALLASFGGLLIGIFFLSFTYHHVLWIFLGLAGATYSAIKRHDPKFNVRFGFYDLLIALSLDAAFVIGLYVMTRIKGV
jgi:hypothetical protein